MNLRERADKSILEFNNVIKQSRKPTFDSSAIIPLATIYPSKLLNEIISHPLFFVTPLVFSELQGLQRTHPELTAIVKKIVDLQKIGRPDPQETKRHEIMFQALVPILPRKIVHELVVTDQESYVTEGISLFREGQEKLKRGAPFNEVLAQIIAESNRSRKKLQNVGKAGMKRALERSRKLYVNLEDFDWKAYQQTIESETRRIDVEIQSIIHSSGANIEKLCLAMEQFKSKTYHADIRHMAELTALGFENITEDSDQIFLLEFHARRAA